MMRFLPALLLLCACAQFPELDSTQTPGVDSMPYPRLVPVDTLLTGDTPEATPEMRDGVLGRVSALQSRADGLRAPVVDAATQAQMARGVADPQ
ncbi:hypothetical protein P775_27990 [Puniceibacterium antarcticum]|uniref:Uncharacterized protein n=1 Tax=Puniceibacterium antarcticum TaxID=1206336 RepID=A0A2G8QY33_9RHOB|nr:hypothetical protein [Puniceibacterium antarcticum]PIL13808.1 hypothetical protein P775_27990 [Puniceibacterium antarcticum]